jgi:hypothetical protein
LGGNIQLPEGETVTFNYLEGNIQLPRSISWVGDIQFSIGVTFSYLKVWHSPNRNSSDLSADQLLVPICQPVGAAAAARQLTAS